VVFNGTSDFALPVGGSARFIFVTEGRDDRGMEWRQYRRHRGEQFQERRDLQGLRDWRAERKALSLRGQLPLGEHRSLRQHLPARSHAGSSFVRRDDDEDDNSQGPEFKGKNHFAPFNVQAIGTNLYVAYAKQDADKEDEVAGPGLGSVQRIRPPQAVVCSVSSAETGSTLRGEWPWPLASSVNSATPLLVGMFGSGRLRRSIRSMAAFSV
jgi:hypothetical protein